MKMQSVLYSIYGWFYTDKTQTQGKLTELEVETAIHFGVPSVEKWRGFLGKFNLIVLGSFNAADKVTVTQRNYLESPD